MDDVIIIILTLVLTIVAAVNQSRKKKQQTPTAEGTIPDIWEEILHGGRSQPYPDEDEEPVILREPVRTPVPVVVKPTGKKPVRPTRASTPPMDYGYLNESGRNEDIIRFNRGKNTEEQKLETSETSENILSDFSLKKAVIYSEIINPKYF